jgi:high affinity Mn2+ porin
LPPPKKQTPSLKPHSSTRVLPSHSVRQGLLGLFFSATACSTVVFVAVPAGAQVAPPAAHEDEAFDVMNLLAQRGMHDVHHESWNIYGQSTYISSWKLPFRAPYTNANGSTNSLLPGAERSFTGSLSLFFGVKLWPGGEAYFVPEVISERPLSNLHGLGGSIQNFELQKGGSETPQLYRARTFLRQTIGLGGDKMEKVSDPMQLAGVVDRRRVVLTVGSFTILDVFDRNNVTWDPRQTFFNMAFMAHSSWDFPSDARGYSWGGTAELNWDDWALRVGRITPPQNPNQLPTDFRLYKFYGDQVEVEHDHQLFGRSGAVRLLAFRNRVNTGRFVDAIDAYETDPRRNATTCPGFNYGSGNESAPDLCWVRRPNVKVGVGLNVEQYVDENIGLFLRAMYADGQTEVEAFNPADRSLSFGVVAKGALWHRRFDVTGVGFAAAWISSAHARYLERGGVDGFVGDGHLRQGTESVFDVFYSVNFLRALWLSADYQFISNPAFNADRGPVHVLGGRVHAEF